MAMTSSSATARYTDPVTLDAKIDKITTSDQTALVAKSPLGVAIDLNNSGADQAIGNAGNDTLTGTAGDDWLIEISGGLEKYRWLSEPVWTPQLVTDKGPVISCITAFMG